MTAPDQSSDDRTDRESMSHDEAAEIVTQDETLQAAGSDNDEADAGTDEESRP